jgi:tetratricopeptide (TPR) repeat protein
MNGNKDKKIEALTQLLAADPTNAKLQAQVVNELAASGKPEAAIPIIEKAVADNPGDVSLVKLYFLILGAAKDLKKMAVVGEDLAKMDTASADQAFYEKMLAAYSADSQHAKAAQTAALATVKFPKVASLWVARGQLERKAGQTQQSVESLKKALALDPKVEGARMAIINSFIEQNQLDSAFLALHEAKTAGEDPSLVGTFALTVGNRLYKAGAASKLIADYEKALPWLTFADSVTKEPQTKTNAKFLIGVTAFSIGQTAAQEAPKTKSCELAQKASDMFVIAQINLPAGGSINPAATQQLLTAIPQFLPAVDGQVKQFCKK